jgi:lysophospholipase L1-like esterase
MISIKPSFINAIAGLFLKTMVKAFLLLTVLTSFSAKAQEKAKQADLAVDMAGLNTHFSYQGIYTDKYEEIIKPRLVELGIRHLRDGVFIGKPVYEQRVLELASLGMNFILICDQRFEGKNISALKDQVMLFNKGAVKPVEMIEGPNEFDCPDQTGFMADLATQTKALWNAFKNDPKTAYLPIAGPSFCNTKESPGRFADFFPDAAAYMQYGNLHNYPGGHNVEGRFGGGWGITLDASLAAYKRVSKADTLIVTESGYKKSEDMSGHISVTERAAAKYIPRMFLSYLNKGIKRTYLYQLINNSEDFGIINTDGTPRQQFTAIKNYINLLKDPGAPFETGSLNYKLTGNITNINHTLLQKRNGNFYLIVWQGVNSADSGMIDVESPLRKIKLQLSTRISKANIYLPTFAGKHIQQSSINPTQIALSIPDHILVVELIPVKKTIAGRIRSIPVKIDVAKPSIADNNTPGTVLYDTDFSRGIPRGFVNAGNWATVKGGVTSTATGLKNYLMLNRQYSVNKRKASVTVSLGADTKFTFFSVEIDNFHHWGSMVQIDAAKGLFNIHENYNVDNGVYPPVLISHPYSFKAGQDYTIEMMRDNGSNKFIIVDKLAGLTDTITEANRITSGLVRDVFAFAAENGTPPIVKSFKVTTAYKPGMKILYMGDSITEGLFSVPDAFIQYGAGAISGRSGGRVQGVINRTLSELPYLRPQYVSILIGTNDGNTVENLTYLCQSIIKLGITPILNNLPWRITVPVKHDNEVIAAVRKNLNLKGAAFDVATSINGANVQQDPTVFFDGIHPNPEGMHRMFKQFKQDVPEVFK